MENLPKRDWDVWRDVFESYYLKTFKELYPTEDRLHQACCYAMEGRGKRIRPLLALASCHAIGSDYSMALPAACAVEWVHTSSLVHDDLPCMDNDDWRRGRLTTHKQFDEALALLVGDALLMDAFLLLTRSEKFHPQMISILVEAAGGRGMVHGQSLDLHWTGRDDFTRKDLDSIHLHKTADLIAASCMLGAATGGADRAQLELFREFGMCLGLAFQIIDDLLDNCLDTGKSAGKDEQSGKLTYLRLMDREEALREATRLTERTLELLDPLGDRAQQLKDISAQLLKRSR